MSPLIRCETMWTSSPRRARNEASARLRAVLSAGRHERGGDEQPRRFPFAPPDRREEEMWPAVSGSMMLRPCGCIEHRYRVTWCELRLGTRQSHAPPERHAHGDRQEEPLHSRR